MSDICIKCSTLAEGSHNYMLKVKKNLKQRRNNNQEVYIQYSKVTETNLVQRDLGQKYENLEKKNRRT